MGEAGFEVCEEGEQKGTPQGDQGNRSIVHGVITKGKGADERGDWRCSCVTTGQAGFAAGRLASPRSGLAAPVLTHLTRVLSRFANVFSFLADVFTPTPKCVQFSAECVHFWARCVHFPGECVHFGGRGVQFFGGTFWSGMGHGGKARFSIRQTPDRPLQQAQDRH